MDYNQEKLPRQVDLLRRTLPISGYPRPILLSQLRARGVSSRGAPRLTVIDMFLTSGSSLMCRFAVAGADTRTFVAPLALVSLDRRHHLAHVFAEHDRTPRRDAT